MKKCCRTNTMSLIVISAYIAATGGLAGCENGSSQHGTTAKITPPIIDNISMPASGHVAHTMEPLAPYDFSYKENDTLFQARKLLTISCMHKSGFSNYLGEDIHSNTMTDSESSVTQPAGPWGYLGSETARLKGFQSGKVTDLSTLPPVRQMMSEAERVAAEKCFTQSGKELNKDGDTTSDLVKRLTSEADNYASKDARVVEARKAWGQCMAASGFSVTDPAALAAQNWGRRAVDPPTQDEIRTAEADEKCTTSSRLAAVYFAVNWGYQRQLIELNAQELAERQRAIRSQLDKALQIIASGSSPS